MAVYGISSKSSNYNSNSEIKSKPAKQKEPHNDQKQVLGEDKAAAYDKEQTGTSKTGYESDTVTIERLKADADKRSQSLRELVEKMLLKQGQTLTVADDIYALLREGKVQVDPETKAQAQKDIAEDGYWGVEQTSERLVSFAKALTGGDPSKADEMIEAIKKGYEAAEKAWGGNLPEISQKTLEAAISKMEVWRDEISTVEADKE